MNEWQNSQIEYTLLMIWDISNREKKMRDMTQRIEITKKFLPKFDIFVDKLMPVCVEFSSIICVAIQDDERFLNFLSPKVRFLSKCQNTFGHASRTCQHHSVLSLNI